MDKRKLKPDTHRQLAEANLHVNSLWQPSSLFQRDDRKLKQVAQPGDPWTAQLFYPDVVTENGPSPLHPLFISWGEGSTADEAVLDALRKASGIEGSMRKLAGALEILTGVLRAAR